MLPTACDIIEDNSGAPGVDVPAASYLVPLLVAAVVLPPMEVITVVAVSRMATYPLELPVGQMNCLNGTSVLIP